jgi:hypothetical protein
MTTTDERTYVQQYVGGLRDLADFLEKYPVLIEDHSGVRAYRFVRDGDDPADLFTGLASLLDTPEIGDDGTYFNATQRFGPHQLQVTMPIKLVQPKVAHPLVGDES